MPLPVPVPGLVLRYSYLWHSEHVRGQEEGIKDRPCAIVMTVVNSDGEQVVTVLPVTHTPPADTASAIEIPLVTKQRLGLDAERSWVVVTEANRFTWPGPDLRVVSGGEMSSSSYGLLPREFYYKLRARFDAAISTQLARVVPRTK